MHRALQAGEAYRALVTALQQHQDKASRQRKGKFGHSTADEMHFSLASLEVCAALACASQQVMVVQPWQLAILWIAQQLPAARVGTAGLRIEFFIADAVVRAHDGGGQGGVFQAVGAAVGQGDDGAARGGGCRHA